MKLGKLGLVIAGLAVAVLAGPSVSGAVDLPACDNFTCARDGDFIVQSLPFSGADIQSSPGQIAGGVVVYTGAGGASSPVVVNFAGMDNAYPAVGGKSGGTSFHSGTTADPTTGTKAGQTFQGDQAGTWDSTISAFLTFLNGASPIFFFNQNQENSGTATDTVNCPGSLSAQDVCLYGSITLFNSQDPTVTPVILELESPTRPFSPPSPSGTDGIATLPAEYVLAKGDVCLDQTTGVEVACGSPNATQPVNHNLGADHAAYAAFSELLNSILATCASQAGCPYDTLSIRFDLTGLNNGFEQLFILTTEFVIPPPPVPVPATLLLLGSGLVGLGGGMAWRARRRG
jgi:hypothetical protein